MKWIRTTCVTNNTDGYEMLWMLEEYPAVAGYECTRLRKWLERKETDNRQPFILEDIGCNEILWCTGKFKDKVLKFVSEEEIHQLRHDLGEYILDKVEKFRENGTFLQHKDKVVEWSQGLKWLEQISDQLENQQWTNGTMFKMDKYKRIDHMVYLGI